MSDVRKDVGIVTAYGYAVEGGYQGTEAQYTELMGSVANIAQEATDAKTAAETAQGKAEDAQEAAETAQEKAEDAQKAAERAQGLADDAKTAAGDSASSASESALKAEGFAVGEQNGVEVGSDSPYYHNNAKYYSEEAGDSATQAAASAATSAAMTGLAPQFDSTKAYSAGDYVLYSGTLYQFTSAHAAGAWTGTDAVATVMSNGVTDLKSQLEKNTGNATLTNWTRNAYYKSGSNTSIDIEAPTTTGAVDFKCLYVPCNPGDIFYVTAHGTAAARPYVFLSSASGENNIISKASSAEYDLADAKIVAPANTAYAVFNASINYDSLIIKGEPLVNKVNANTVGVAENAAEIDTINTQLAVLQTVKSVTKTGELIDNFTTITSIGIANASSAVVKNAQMFEGLYPGTINQFGVDVIKNDDGTYTFNGQATTSAWFALNQTTRTGTENVITLNGTYSFGYDVVSGSYDAGSFVGLTYGVVGLLDPTSNQFKGTVVLGSETTVRQYDFTNQNVVIGFQISRGVIYKNLRIAIMLNKGYTLFKYAKYVSPTTVTDFDTILSVAKNSLPYLWITTTPNTATISVSGKVIETPEAGTGVGNLYGVLEKYNDRVDTLAQMFNKQLFLIYTDIHASVDNLKRIAEWHKANRPIYVRDIYCLGDIVYDQATEPIAFADNDFWKKTLVTIGNHDVLVSNTIPGITAVECYNKYIAPNVASWGVTQPTNAATDGKCYYYKDYNSKVRVIVLDMYFYTTEQHSWFEITLEDARTNNLAVIVIEHADICTASEKHPLNSDYPFARKHDGYSGLQYSGAGNGDNHITRRNAVDTFIGNGGSFVCWLVGHQHADMTGTYDGGTNGKQLSVVLSNASQNILSSIRVNNYSQDCFTYLAVDTDTHYLYLLRIGEAVDKWFHQNLFLCYDYANHIVVEYH